MKRRATDQGCREHVDLAIIGGGSAGFAAALRAADLGARVALINSGPLGGTCVNVGCVPSKTLIRAAERHHQRSHHPFEGVPHSNESPDWTAITGQKDALVDRLRQQKYRDILKTRASIRLIEAEASFESANQIVLSDGSSVTANKVVVTTGSSPAVAEIPGLSGAGYLTSETAMVLDQLPETMAVVGGGFVALELGQMFQRLGCRVTMLVRGEYVLREEDPAIGKALTEYLRSDGVEVITGADVHRVDRQGEYRILRFRESDGAGHDIRTHEILIATGRRPRTDGFGLQEIGIALDSQGGIRVDRYLQTNHPTIYAAGDVTGDPMFVYVAAHAGATAAENALMGNTRVMDLSAVPRVIFSNPAVAAVGLTESQARAMDIEPIVSTLPLEYVPRSLADHDTRGFIRLVAEAQSRRLVGAHILAVEAGEMIMEPTLAIRFGLTVDDLTSTLHPYLTLGEGIRLAAQTFDKNVTELSCCAA